MTFPNDFQADKHEGWGPILGLSSWCTSSFSTLLGGWVLVLIPERKTLDANGRRSGLVFFGTPHKGTNQGHIGLLKTMFSKFFHNGVRERLPSLQLGLEALGIAFRHQVEDYKFVSFYSDTDQVRNQTQHYRGRFSRLQISVINEFYRLCQSIQRYWIWQATEKPKVASGPTEATYAAFLLARIAIKGSSDTYGCCARRSYKSKACQPDNR